MTHQVYIGLGSNLDCPKQQLLSAIDHLNQLAKIRVITISPFYGSHAVGPGQQPDYVNAAAELATELDADSLLTQLQAIEIAHGRIRGSEQWIARTLDLDILLFDQEQIRREHLQIPHPRMHLRNFVLQPLHDLNPELTLPDGHAIRTLLDGLGGEGLWQLPS